MSKQKKKKTLKPVKDKIDFEKFKAAGWEFSEDPNNVYITFKSPRMTDMYCSYIHKEDKFATNKGILDLEYAHFRDTRYRMAMQEMPNIISDSIKENFKPLTI